MLRWYKADLHIHTVLSCCAELSMGPHGIVQRALELGLDIIAITDHNSALNVTAVMHAAQHTGLTVIPGVEAATDRDAHIICLFPNLDAASAFEQRLHPALAAGQNDPAFIGPQYVVDANENILEENKDLLMLATRLNCKELASRVLESDGILYPAHIDRRGNSILRTLGYLPPEPFAAVEISSNISPERALQEFPFISSYPIIQSSDAHDLSQIGKAATWFKLAAPTFDEIVRALKFEHGRQVSIKSPATVQELVTIDN